MVLLGVAVLVPVGQLSGFDGHRRRMHRRRVSHDYPRLAPVSRYPWASRIEGFEGRVEDADRVNSHGLTLLVRQRRKPWYGSWLRS